MSDERKRPAYVFAGERDWPGYFDVVAGKPARETLVRAIEVLRLGWQAEDTGETPVPRGAVGDKGAPLAIDLGCGEGRDTAELLRHAFRVLAIDGHPDAIARIDARSDLTPEERARLTTRLQRLEAVELEPCTLLNASFALPFCPPPAFAGLWAKIVDAIKPGGIFAGQLFGDRDDWASLPDRSHQTRPEIEAMLRPFELIRFDEEEKDANDAFENPKHWHVFHVVGRKRAEGAS